MTNEVFGSLSDIGLLQHIIESNEAAFEEFYQRYNAPVFNYLLRLICDNGAAEELLQDVFLIIWQEARDFRGDASVKTWLFRIAHHRAVSWLRQRRENTNGDLEILTVTDVAIDPEGQTIAAWKAKQVHAALASLSIKHRAVLELAVFYGLPYTEIAQVIQCPIGTVKSRVSYARRCLLQYFKNNGLSDLSEK